MLSKCRVPKSVSVFLRVAPEESSSRSMVSENRTKGGLTVTRSSPAVARVILSAISDGTAVLEYDRMRAAHLVARRNMSNDVVVE